MSTPSADGTTVVLLTRHAERASEDANSNLSSAGLERADALVALAREHGVRAVYTTDLCRTAQTGQPAARAQGVPLRILATASSAAGLDTCTPPITLQTEPAGGMDAAAAATTIRARHPGGAVLVVGHSNTVPALLEALTGESPCPGLIPLDPQGRCFLPDAAYGDVFIVRMPTTGEARVERTRIGR